MLRRSAGAAAVVAALMAVQVVQAGSAMATDVTPVPGDPLTGSGDVDRTALTAPELDGGTGVAPVPDSAFALPEQAAMPAHTLEGRLALPGVADSGGFTSHRDDFGYVGSQDHPRKHLPALELALVQNGSHLVPVPQGLLITGHAYWNVIVGPGRAWRENGDGGRSRAALPFSLVERNANCTHNGVLTFLFDSSSISQVRSQITQETCLYFKFDMWGQLSATYLPGAVPDATAVKNAHAAEVANRLPTKPISQLASDFPGSGVDPSVFGGGLTPEHVSTYGVLVDGTNYVSGCATRYGEYAFCGDLRLPSYSLAKTVFAGTAMLRLAQKYGPQVSSARIADHVPEHEDARGEWSAVTIDHALDMTTGNYRFVTYLADEGGRLMTDFFLAEPYQEKIYLAFRFQRRTAPGNRWVYHTSDTFIAAAAMQSYLRGQEGPGAGIFDLVGDEVYQPALLSAGAMTTLRTGNRPDGAAFGGYGLFFNRDDVAKLAKLLNNDHGNVAGSQLLHSDLLAATMQQDPADRGMNTTSSEDFWYNNGLWAKELTPVQFPQYGCSFWVPFMSGYGGITVAMMPNGVTYYYFSDNDEFAWYGAVHEAHKLSPHC